MSLGIDPVVSNILFTLSLIPHCCGSARRTETEMPPVDPADLPFISVIVALYREGPEDIGATFLSLLDQSYPKHLCEVMAVVEPDDALTLEHLRPWPPRLARAGLACEIVCSDGVVHSKPHALNLALPRARGEYFVFYDGADRIDRAQLLCGITTMLRQRSDVAQARVLRDGPSLLSRFLLFDTVTWYWKYLPLLLRFVGGFPLSGEGLFLRAAALHEAGGFPEVLTEDALLGLRFIEAGKRFSLVDSNVVERAPSRARGHLRQKMRWHRGYLTCLRQLLFSLHISRGKKLILLLPFSVPFCSALGFVGWTLILGTLLVWTLWGFEAIDFSPFASVLYNEMVYDWSLFLALFGIPFAVFSSVRAIRAAGRRMSFPLPLLLPLYWMFVGACALCSFFRGTKDWGKTDRGHPVEQQEQAPAVAALVPDGTAAPVGPPAQ